MNAPRVRGKVTSIRYGNRRGTGTGRGTVLAAGVLALWFAGTAIDAQTGRCDVRVERWGIHLEIATVASIHASRDDLIVTDMSRSINPVVRFTVDEVAAMKTGPDGRRRLVLAYISIGQAEEYRDFWRDEWRAVPPEWLDAPDADWPDNYEVRFWHPDWQALVFGAKGALVDTALALGFDGVMLDGVDAFETWEERRATAPDEMVEFVHSIATYARAHDGNFLIFPLNAENLLPDRRFLEVIDGVVKEDLFFGQGHRLRRNDPSMIDWATYQLQLARGRGLPVLVLEYIPPGALRDEAAARIDAAGYLGSFAERPLRRMSESHPAAAGAITSAGNGAACRAP